MMKGMKLFGGLALIFGIVVIVSVFLSWLTSLYGATVDFSGWKILNDNMWDYGYIVVAALISGGLSAIIGLMALGGSKTKLYGLVVLLAGIASAATPVAWYYYDIAGHLMETGFELSDILNAFKPGIGMYFCMLSGILLLITGIIGLASNTKE